MRKIWTGTAKRTTVSGTINGSVTTINCVDLSGWPVTGPFVAVLDPGTTSEEWILCDSRASNTITVNVAGRGYVGTGVAHTNCAIRHAPDFNTIDETNRFANLMTAKGDLVGFDGSLAQRVAATTVDGMVPRSRAGAAAGYEWSARSAIPTFATMAARDAALTGAFAPSEGDQCITTTEDRLWIYDGTRWVKLLAYSPTGRDLVLTRSTLQTIPNATVAAIVFDTEVNDWDGWGVAPTAVWTVPAGRGGLYIVQMQAITNNATGSQALNTYLNGTLFGTSSVDPKYAGRVPSASFDDAINPKGYGSIVWLVAGDTVEMRINNTSGGSRDYSSCKMQLDRIIVGANN